MIEFPKAPIKLSELAKKWNKTEDDLVCWIATNQMRAFCWYEGSVVYESIIEPIVSKSDFYKGWVVPSGVEIEPLLAKKNVNLTWFTPTNYVPYPHLKPTKEQGTAGQLERSSFAITRDDLFVMSFEVERMEREYPELVSEKQEHTISAEIVTSGSKNDNQLAPADGTPKKRDIPKENTAVTIREIAKYVGYSVSAIKNSWIQRALIIRKQVG